jgi:hypothetical protein
MVHTPSYVKAPSVQQEATVPSRARHIKDATGTSIATTMGAARERIIAEDDLRNMIDA